MQGVGQVWVEERNERYLLVKVADFVIFRHSNSSNIRKPECFTGQNHFS